MARKLKYNTKQRKDNRQKESDYINDLNTKIQEYDTKTSTSQFFEDLPISDKTVKGLKENAFLKMTDIQKESIPMCLKNFDVLGSARTGSGKTLAFLIPVLEKLYRERWTEFDGLGALIISPTRELAMQIYEVLVKIGKYHSFGAGLVIGGKDVKFEKERISKMNVLIGTPGRILQHMDQTIGFNTSNLQILVLDEADRCLDMGFSKTLDSIVDNLPASRQTLLYSATQSQSLQNLARLSLTNYKTCGESINNMVMNKKDGNNKNNGGTPEALKQSYITVPLPDKLDILYSFIKTHLKNKIIVFFSSSKQVHFVYETFRKLQPGISLMHLHGRQKQTARTDTLDKFSRAQHVVLFATDVVSRGIDFPAVDWVVQLDCPEDVDTYIHRAGRSARNGKAGENLLLLTPQEEPGMLARMKTKHIEPTKLNIKQSKKKSIKPQLQSLLFKDPELKYLAQKTFISYVKSIYIQKDKEVFKFEDLPSEEFAKSLGLPGAPKIKFKGMKSFEKAKELKNSSRQLQLLARTNENGDLVNEKSDKPRTKIDKMFQRKNQNVLSDHYMNITKQQAAGGEDKEEEEDDFMTVKRTDHALKEDELPELIVPTSKRAQKKALSKKASLSTKGNPTRLKFDDDGTAHPIYELIGEEDFHKEGDVDTQKKSFLAKESELMANADITDKELAKEKKQEKKRKRLEQMRKEMEADMSDASEEYEDDAAQDYDIGTGNLSDDMESEDEEERSYKKRKYTNNSSESDMEDDNVIEVEEPQTLEDLESLTAKLIQG